MNLRTHIFWLCWVVTPSASAQVADTLRLPEIRVTDAALATRHVQLFAAKPADADASIAMVLARSGGALRSYAPGILETLSLRGFTASQTQVLWNGFPLNHAMVGLTDLSLYPAFLFDGMMVDKAGGSSDHALSALGGTVDLRSNSDGRFTSIASLGAFGQRGFGVKTGHEWGPTRIRIGIHHQRSDNDFRYRDVFSAPVTTRRRINASREHGSATVHLHRIGNRLRQDHHFFLTQRESGIPGPISASSSKAMQADRILRVHSRTAFRIGPGWGTLALNGTNQDLDYIDTGVNSLSTVRAFGVRGGFGIRDARLFIERSQTWVEFSEYAAPDRVMWTAQGDVRRGRISASARTDHDSAYGWFWSASAGARLGAWKAHLSRTVGIPTFNDLYWPVLGNPDLRPESAIKSEVTWEGTFKGWHLALPLHAAQVEDGIQWIPGIDGRFRPRNVRQTRTIGAEPELKRGESRLYATFTDARYKADRFAGDRAEGRQVAYIPKWVGGAEHTVRWKAIYLNPEVRYTGRRATTDDGLFPIDPQLEADVTLGAKIKRKLVHVDASATVRNLTDTDLGTIRWYPMPGRHLTFMLQIRIP